MNDDIEPGSRECSEEIMLGRFELSENSMEKLPYQKTDNVVIFTNSTEGELSFIVETNDTANVLVKDFVNCISNPNFSQHFQYTTEYRIVQLYNQTNELTLKFLLNVQVDLTESGTGSQGDFLAISIKNKNYSNVSYRLLGLYTDAKQHTEEYLKDSMFFYEFDLEGKKLTDVFVQEKQFQKSDEEPLTFITAYNLNQGLLSFSDYDGHQWFFDRIE